MDTTAQLERSRDLERFLTFIDAVVAIAVTLLVLPLVDLVSELESGISVRQLLEDNTAPIGAFFLSFLVISQVWLGQHRLVRNVIGTNEALTRLLLLWSLTIVVLPFPTALVAGPHDAGGEAITKVLYVGTMAVGALLLGLMAVVISRHPELRDAAESPDPVHAFGTCVVFLVALALMLAVPATSYWPLALLAVQERLTSLVATRRNGLRRSH
jgi:uncharacterized membrane protein